MEEQKFNFENLKVYQKAIDFVDLIYKICDEFPKTERYALSSQFTRAAVSIALNIAEGSSDSSSRQNYISKEINYDIREKLVELSKMITSRQNFLKLKLTSKF